MEFDTNKTEPIQELLASKKQEKPEKDFFKTFSLMSLQWTWAIFSLKFLIIFIESITDERSKKIDLTLNNIDLPTKPTVLIVYTWLLFFNFGSLILLLELVTNFT